MPVICRALALLMLALLLTGTLRPSLAATYYMSPHGSDANRGTATSPWATPNHALHCGDTIEAAPGTYGQLLNWGTVSCPANNNVAWVTCAQFDACRIEVKTGGPYAAGIQVGASYWGVRGWEVSVYPGGGSCFFAYPARSGTSIHHIVFADDICNGAGQGGFALANHDTAGVDYFAAVGDIAYNATQGNLACTSGFNTFRPVAADTRPGTHIYFAGDFAFDNVEPATCAGTVATDGQGFFFDTTTPYAQLMVMENNLAAYNGGGGFKAYDNTRAPMVVRHNTSYGNQTGEVNGGVCAEIALQSNAHTEVYGNLAATRVANACRDKASLYVLGVVSPDGTDRVYANYGFSSVAHHTTGAGPGFAFGQDNLFSDPVLENPVNPGPPECSGKLSVPDCMRTVSANFTPRSATAKGFGFARESEGLFPRWLCQANLPPGLVSVHCQ